MDSSSWDVAERIVAWLDAESPVTGDTAMALRVLKVGEEFGEVAEALHGAMGGNPRKGRSHTWDDVHKELVDVAVTSLVALVSLTPEDARTIFEERVRQLGARLPGPGTPDR